MLCSIPLRENAAWVSIQHYELRWRGAAGEFVAVRLLAADSPAAWAWAERPPVLASTHR